MLKTKRKITIDGESVINGVSVAGFRAHLNQENPSDITFSSWQNDKQAYKDNRSQARADEAEFEDYCYAMQDAMIAEREVVDEAEE